MCIYPFCFQTLSRILSGRWEINSSRAKKKAKHTEQMEKFNKCLCKHKLEIRKSENRKIFLLARETTTLVLNS